MRLADLGQVHREDLLRLVWQSFFVVVDEVGTDSMLVFVQDRRLEPRDDRRTALWTLHVRVAEEAEDLLGLVTPPWKGPIDALPRVGGVLAIGEAVKIALLVLFQQLREVLSMAVHLHQLGVARGSKLLVEFHPQPLGISSLHFDRALQRVGLGFPGGHLARTQGEVGAPLHGLDELLLV